MELPRAARFWARVVLGITWELGWEVILVLVILVVGDDDDDDEGGLDYDGNYQVYDCGESCC